MTTRTIGLVLLGLLWMAAGIVHAQTDTKHYYYTDPQGTVLAKADAQGNIVATYDYAPYGTQVLGAPLSGPTGYTGHVNDAESGLVYMQARYYDPEVGRFLSTDPVTPSPGNTFNFNRYDYANNNPIVNIDPDGRRVEYVSGAPSDFKQNFAAAIKYLNAAGAAGNFAVLQSSKNVYKIGPAQDRKNPYQTQYSGKTKTITWADKGGVMVMDAKSGKLKVETPAMAVGHEAEHGLHDENGTFKKDNSTPDKAFNTVEEKKVIQGYENKAAGKLGEPIRSDHFGHGRKVCGSPTKC